MTFFYLLIERGAEVNVASRIGLTPLMMAASGGRIKIVKFLLDRGADVTAMDNKGRTARDIAVERKRVDVQKLLEIQ